LIAYLQSASCLDDPSDWIRGFRRVERALRLAVQLGRNSTRFPKVIGHIEQSLTQYAGADPLFLSASLMELLLEHGIGNPATYSVLSETAAVNAESKQEWYRARHYWEIKARWDKQIGEEGKHDSALIRAAEMYIQEANDAARAEHANHAVAAHHLQSALVALRAIPHTQRQRGEVHRLLLEYQERSTAELHRYSAPIDLAESAELAVRQVASKPLIEALVSLSQIHKPPTVASLRSTVEEAAKHYPLQHIIPSFALNEYGKVVGRRPSLLNDDPHEKEAALLAEMFGQANQQQSIVVMGVIEPARRQINLEHNVRMQELMQVVTNNPFVPNGRELIYAQGIHAGLTGDLATAIHLLIPQLENSIRHVLNQHGVITSSLDQYGIQQEYDLNHTLYMPELTQIFGEDTVFDLKGLLVEPFGSNLRNRMAHGLLSYGNLVSTDAVYVWWIALRFCCWPVLLKLNQRNAASGGQQESDTALDSVAGT
jgi:hypothetical protein